MTQPLPELPQPLRRGLQRGGRGLTLLVVRLGAMGDVLRTLPAVRLLRRALPDARISWAVEESWRILLDGHADLDGLVCAPRRDWDRWRRSPIAWPALVASLREYRRQLVALGADLAVDFHGNLRSGLTAWLSRAPVRLGYAGHQQKEGNRWLTTHRVAAGDRRTPRPERNLALVRALGLPVDHPPPCELPLVAAGRAGAERIVAELGAGRSGLVVVAPGASRRQAYKEPPAALLAAACRRTAAHGLLPLVVYGPGEEPQARRVVERSGGRGVLAPPTDLPRLGALLERARLFVGGDSGPLHLACAVGCPVVAIYGPTDPRVNRFWGVAGHAVHPPGRSYSGIKRLDRRAGGFDGLGEDEVAAAVDAMLARPRDARADPA